MKSRILLKAIISGARPKTLAAGVVPFWAGGVLAWKLVAEAKNNFHVPVARGLSGESSWA